MFFAAKSRLGLLVCALAFTAFPAFAQDSNPEISTGKTGLKGGTAKSYMVVAANPIAAAAGAEILKAGGTAVDAAIAVQLVLNLVEPQSSGIGGGAFMLHWDQAKHALTTYDGRETAPAAAAENRFLTADGKPMGRFQAIVGGKSVGVPGVVRMLDVAHKAHGKLTWAQVFAPALRIADQGFAISPRLYALLAGDNALRNWEPARSFYYQADGSPKPVGSILKNPEFAATLRAIIKDGPDAFYTGKIAADIVRAVTTAPANAGDMTLADLKNYQAKERAPVCGPYRQKKVCGMGPPSSGGIGVIQTLGILEHFDMRAAGANSVKAYHAIAEAGRLVLADRATYIADSDFVPVPTDALIAPDYLSARAALINPAQRMPTVAPGKVPVKGALNLVPADSPERPSTSHFSIVDKYGNAVAMTTSVEGAFGSHLMVDGFILNNQLTDFSYEDVAAGRTVANRVEGNKRPRSSMSPTVVFDKDGKLEMLAGSPGGALIVGFVVKTLVAMIDWDMSPAEATAAPHILVNGRGVEIEPGTPLEAAKAELEALGHQVRVGDNASGLHVIRITKNGLEGGADPRREGAVVGQ